jgi:hypothetical protein
VDENVVIPDERTGPTNGGPARFRDHSGSSVRHTPDSRAVFQTKPTARRRGCVSTSVTFFPELNEPGPARPAAARPASRDESRPAPGGASVWRTERRRRIDSEDPVATYLPGLVATADSS